MKTGLSANQYFCALALSVLLLLTSGCEKNSVPQFSLTTSSQNTVYILKATTETGTSIPIGEFHNWIITVTDQNNKPVNKAIFAITGGMPAHGHGLPTQPQITRHLGEGRYLMEGVKFTMSGDWVIRIKVASGDSVDTAQFDFNVSH